MVRKEVDVLKLNFGNMWVVSRSSAHNVWKEIGKVLADHFHSKVMISPFLLTVLISCVKISLSFYLFILIFIIFLKF